MRKRQCDCYWHLPIGGVSTGPKLDIDCWITTLVVFLGLPLVGMAGPQSIPAQVISRFETARKAESMSNYREAAAIYKAIIKHYPLAVAYNNLGLDYYRMKEYHRAAQSLRDGLKLNPHMVGAHLFLGLSEYSLGNFKSSAEDLRNVLKVDQQNREAWLYLIRSESALGDFYIDDGQHALRLFPKDSELSYAVGNGALDQIRLIADRASQMGPQSPVFLWMELRKAQAENNTVLVRQLKKEIRNAGWSTPPPLTKKYGLLKKLVYKSLKNTLAVAPKSSYAYRVKGMIYESEGLDKKAVREYELGDDNFAAGRLLAQDLQLKSAAKELNAAIADDPLNRLASALLARVYVKDQLPGMALPILHSLLREYPDDAYAWADLGKAQAQLKQREAALKSLQRALALDPSLNKLHYKMAMIYRGLGKEDLAREQIRIFLKHSKKNPNVVLTRSTNDEQRTKATTGIKGRR